MAKVTDLNLIKSTAEAILDLGDYNLTDFLGREQAAWCLVAIYTTNDLCKGYGQDFTPKNGSLAFEPYQRISIISFENGVSVILDSQSSRYQDSFPMCGYVDLSEDLYQIAICIQAAIDRIETR